MVATGDSSLTIEQRTADVALSLCGPVRSPTAESADVAAFEKHRIDFDQFSANATTLLKDKRLVVRIGGKHYPCCVAAPLLFSLLVFKMELDSGVLQQLWQQHYESNDGDDNGGVDNIADAANSTEIAPATPARRNTWLWGLLSVSAPPTATSTAATTTTTINADDGGSSSAAAFDGGGGSGGG
eukprot:CAMPEP_0198312210 /NCGR_PEP_ID=MMETSP1450-20131203/3664_1 /TAXON_ID=753684 ORGANISM="Madagascaria erythrocladiodes, Strain CCMP3234" /NCGR_SAMPLE_ID=MMETSP1450 /ASSEMBLY_ACC=CAM_ASM_001115 /LENGTH=183 /DNA_ID=CAMNT_0044015145 /DNA_START=1 /DNA_END=549 /DNA_ORIENTATION=+